jgi:hypothetical protein
MPPTLRTRKSTSVITSTTPVTKVEQNDKEKDIENEMEEETDDETHIIKPAVSKQFGAYMDKEETRLNGKIFPLRYWSKKTSPALEQMIALPRIYLSPAAVKAFEAEANRIEKQMSEKLEDEGNIRFTNTHSSTIFLQYFTTLLDKVDKIRSNPIQQFDLLFAMTIWAFEENNMFWFMQTEEYLEGGLLAPFMEKLNRVWKALLQQDGYVLGEQSKHFLCEYLNEEAAKVKRGPEKYNIYEFKWTKLKIA